MTSRSSIVFASVMTLFGCSGGTNSKDVTAAEVAYEPGQTGIASKTVQAALDELAARTAPTDHGPRLTAAETSIAELTDGLTTAKSRIDGLAAKDISYAPAAGGDPTTVAAALDALELATAKIGALEAKVQLLESDLAATKAALDGKAATTELATAQASLAALAAKTDPDQLMCPSGMLEYVNKGGFCIDAKAREPHNFDYATYDCLTTGYSLCTASQYVSACDYFDFVPEVPEMVDDIIGAKEVATFLSCESPKVGTTYDQHPYRCCVEKSALVYGKK